jgi:4-hydroxy-3-polyprenylbenzoate decarboxylase
VFHVREVTHRTRPVFQASVVGKPPQEDKYMGEAVQDMFTGVLKVIHPEIVDLWAYFEAGFHNLLVVSVENRYAKEGMKTALGLMGTGQLSLTKMIVLVDADVDPRDRRQVFEAIARHFDPSEDLLVIPGVPLDTLDFTSGRMNLGSKMVLDAQSHARPVGSSGGSAIASRPAAALLETVPDPRAFDARVKDWRLAWGGLLAVQVSGEGRAVVETLVRRPEYEGVRLIAAVSADVPLADDDLLLWGVFTRFDCARDTVPATVETHGACTVCRGPLGIDATWKDGYPAPVENLPEVIQRVDAWWGR